MCKKMSGEKSILNSNSTHCESFYLPPLITSQNETMVLKPALNIFVVLLNVSAVSLFSSRIFSSGRRKKSVCLILPRIYPRSARAFLLSRTNTA